MTKLAIVAATLLAAAGCKKNPQASASSAAPATPSAPAQNAATQYTSDLQKGVQKTQDVAAKANAALQQNSNAVNEANAEGQ